MLAPTADIEIAPVDGARVTPHELLEDFADHVAGWQYLEDASQHYADARNATACVIRCFALGAPPIDLAFASPRADPDAALHLRLVASSDDEPLAAERREAVLDRFEDAFRRYLDEQGEHAQMRVTYSNDAVPA